MLTRNKEPVTAQKIIEAIHGLDDFFCLAEMFRDRDTKAVNNIKAYYRTFEQHRVAGLLTQDVNNPREVFLVVGQTTGATIKVESITHSWAVAADLDVSLFALCEMGQLLTPTFIVETSAGRFHCVWVFDQSVPAHDMGRLAKAIATRVGADVAFARTTQMIRMPGHVNQKNGFLVRLRDDLSSFVTYTWDFLWKAFDGPLYEAMVIRSLPVINHTQRHAFRDDRQSVIVHAESAVQHLANNGYAEHYDTWWRVLSHLTPLDGDGHRIALAFSKHAPAKFKSEEFSRKWASLSKNGTGAVSTLFSMAQSKGWKNPGRAHTEGEGTEARTPTDREFGAEIARALAGTIAAVELPGSGRQKPYVRFQRWNGFSYTALDDIQKRTAVAEAGAKLLENKGNSATAYASLRKKLGNNTSLEDVVTHVAEVLVPLSKPLVVGSYPYLPVKNGVLNLLVGQLVPSNYQPLPIHVCDVEFDPKATAPRFKRFLHEIFCGDRALIDYMLRVLGYVVLGKPKEQLMFILLGPTASNGKSTLIEVVLALLGGFSKRIRTETLMQKSHVNDGASPEVASLATKRMVVVAEPNRNHKLDASLVKQLTGESAITTRGLFADVQDMPIEFVLFMTANVMPFAASDDNGLWRRLHVIPFNRTFKEEEIDVNLKDVLIEERSGVLNMILTGLSDYQKNELKPPPVVTEAVKERRMEADPFEAFVQGRCEIEPHSKIKLKDLYVAYLAWSKENPKFRIITKAELQSHLAQKFGRKTVGNLPIFVGVKLAAE